MKEIYELKEIEKEIKANDNLEYNIIYYNNTYCLLLAGSKYYYLQDNFFGKISVTLFNKKSPYEKRQCDYSKEINNFNDLLNYIKLTKDKDYNDLKDTYNQRLFSELYIIQDNITTLEYLKKISGAREKYILNNLNYIKEIQKNEDYHILKFVDTEGNYFEINTKNRNRLIVG